MDSEKQPEELTRLINKVVGTWDVELTIKLADGSILKGKGELNAKEIVNGFGVRTEMDLDVEGLGKYVEQDLWGYQRWEKKVHLYSITTTAAVHDHAGNWKDDNTLVFHWEGLNEGKPSAEELTLKWVSPDKITGHEIYTADGKVEMELDYTFERK
ncbi:MAG: hypothetical protein QXR63_04630 [Candidatus Bathyarchaeia archaeon]